MKAKNIFVVFAVIAFTTLNSKSNTLDLVKLNAIPYIVYYEDFEKTEEYQMPINIYETQILNEFKNVFLSLQISTNEVNFKLPSFEQNRKAKKLDAESFQIIQLPFNQK